MKTFIAKALKNPYIQRFYPVIVFGCVGSLNAVLSFTLFTLFWHFLHWNYLVAISITFVITAMVQFFGNRKVTFKQKSGNVKIELLKYCVMLITNYFVTMLVVHAMVAWIGVSPYFGIIVAMVCTAILSFLLFKFWIFRVRANVIPP